jgi:predicted nucleotidyltransferase
MNVAGFEAAFEAALRIELEPGLVISVASLPGLAILKTVAWADRHPVCTKDAADLYNILNAFESAGNVDRIFERELDLLESVGYDLTLAGAQLLGRDAAHIADSAATGQIVKLLNNDAMVDLLVSHMLSTARLEENAEWVAMILDCFRRGYLEAAEQSSPAYFPPPAAARRRASISRSIPSTVARATASPFSRVANVASP